MTRTNRRFIAGRGGAGRGSCCGRHVAGERAHRSRPFGRQLRERRPQKQRLHTAGRAPGGRKTGSGRTSGCRASFKGSNVLPWVNIGSFQRPTGRRLDGTQTRVRATSVTVPAERVPLNSSKTGISWLTE